MTVFALGTEVDGNALKFIKETNDRLNGPDITKNPFVGFVILHKHLGKYTMLFSMRCIYPIQPPKFLLSTVSRLGLRKAGYKGKIKSYSKKELINYMVVKLWDRKT